MVALDRGTHDEVPSNRDQKRHFRHVMPELPRCVRGKGKRNWGHWQGEVEDERNLGNSDEACSSYVWME